MGEEGAEWLLTKTIEVGRTAGVIKESSLAEVIVDTTVVEKAIAHPTDARLYEKACRSLVTLAGRAGIKLRQTYNRKAPRLAIQAGRHAPEVDCISKGKARICYEFGTKVSVATTLAEGFVVSMRSMPGNPYDRHTLGEALQQVETLTDCHPSLALVDRAYRGHSVKGTTVLISSRRCGITPKLARLLRRRSAIEPEIGP